MDGDERDFPEDDGPDARVEVEWTDRHRRLAETLPIRDPETGADELRALTPRGLVAALQGGARHADALLDTGDERWGEYLEYIARETPSFQIGGERRIAKRRLSGEAYRIHEALGRSNLLALHVAPIREFLEADRGEEADRVRRLLVHMERATAGRARRAQPLGGSPLD